MTKQVTVGCELCRGSKEPGWLCAEHPTLPWDHDHCGAAGTPCVCNPMGAVAWSEILAFDIAHAAREGCEGVVTDVKDAPL